MLGKICRGVQRKRYRIGDERVVSSLAVSSRFMKRDVVHEDTSTEQSSSSSRAPPRDALSPELLKKVSGKNSSTSRILIFI